MNDYPELRLGDLVTPVQDRIVNRTKWHFDKYIAGEHIDSGEVRIRKCGQIKGNEEVIGSAFHMHFKPGHVLYSTRRAYLRKAGIVDFEGICSNVTLILQSNEEKLLQSLLPFILQSEDFVQFAISHSIGSTNPFVKWTDLSKYKIRVPPMMVQKRISQILWAIEYTIEKTDNLVQITEKFKKGLLEELLTKGISHKKFKKTELGEIPEGWDIKPLSAACSIKNGKSNSEDAVSEGLYDFFDRSTIVKKSNRFLFDCEAVIVPGEGQDFIPKHYHGKFDLHQRAYAICSDKPEISLRYVYYWLNHNRHLLVEYSVCSTVNSLRMGTFEKIKIPIPSPNEQNEIVRIAEKVDYQLNISAEHLSKLRLLQKKLINSFLSGDLSIPKEDIN